VRGRLGQLPIGSSVPGSDTRLLASAEEEEEGNRWIELREEEIREIGVGLAADSSQAKYSVD
jgi:hypothetical protein